MGELVDYANEVRERKLEEIEETQKEIHQLQEKIFLQERKKAKLLDEYNDCFRVVFLHDLRVQAELGKVLLDIVHYTLNEVPKRCLFIVNRRIYDPLMLETDQIKYYLNRKKQIPSLSWMIFFNICCAISIYKNETQNDKNNYRFNVEACCYSDYPFQRSSIVKIKGVGNVVPRQEITIPVDLLTKIFEVARRI